MRENIHTAAHSNALTKTQKYAQFTVQRTALAPDGPPIFNPSAVCVFVVWWMVVLDWGLCLLCVGDWVIGRRCASLGFLLTFSHATRHLALEIRIRLSPFLCSVHIGRRLVVGIGQHRNDRDQNRFDSVHRQPALGGLLVAPLIIAGLVQNADADVSVLLDIRMPDLSDELHARRPQWVFLREEQVSFEEAALAARTFHNLKMNKNKTRN